MEKKYLIINTGSASKKYSFYVGSNKIYNAHFEMEDGVFIVSESGNFETEKTVITKDDYTNAIGFIVNSLINKGIINKKEDIDLVGIRIVAPGEYFLSNQLINEEYLEMAEAALQKVPLHLGPA